MKDKISALFLSCSGTNLNVSDNELFLYLLSLGADVTFRNEAGLSLMHKAAIEDNSYIITYLRDKKGFIVDEKDHKEMTPLHYACISNSEYAIDWLIGFGADVNSKNRDGDQPLHLMIKTEHQLQHTKSVRELIFKGAEKTSKNNKGETPLMLKDQQESIVVKREIDRLFGLQPCNIPCF